METPLHHDDYRCFLRATYVESAKRNPGFSLRAFARHLGLSPAGLSRILNGEKNLSVERAQTISSRLKLDGTEAEYFCLLVQISQIRSPEVKSVWLERAARLRPNGSMHDLSVDGFKAIADWYHLAILECFDVVGLDFNARSIADLLGLNAEEVTLAIDRLVRLELLERDAQGKILRVQDRWLVSSAHSHDAIRKYYQQVLEKASKSIETQPATERAFGTEVFAFDTEQLPEARRLTDQYLNQMLTLSKKSKDRSELYQLAAVFFRLNPKARKPATKKKPRS